MLLTELDVDDDEVDDGELKLLSELALDLLELLNNNELSDDNELNDELLLIELKDDIEESEDEEEEMILVKVVPR